MYLRLLNFQDPRLPVFKPRPMTPQFSNQIDAVACKWLCIYKYCLTGDCSLFRSSCRTFLSGKEAGMSSKTGWTSSVAGKSRESRLGSLPSFYWTSRTLSMGVFTGWFSWLKPQNESVPVIKAWEFIKICPKQVENSEIQSPQNLYCYIPFSEFK